MFQRLDEQPCLRYLQFGKTLMLLTRECHGVLVKHWRGLVGMSLIQPVGRPGYMDVSILFGLCVLISNDEFTNCF